MTKTFKPIIIALLAIMLTSCAEIRESMVAGRPVDLNSIKLGMTKDDVQKQLKKKPDNIVAAKNYPDTNTLIEVVQYSQWGQNSTPVESYWLYFVNGKLDKWETASKEHKP
ncbi:hypothetical protein [Mucilaginibacter pineti]|nr:hypothetical protein [Mucilaginibacter pineti]